MKTKIFKIALPFLALIMAASGSLGFDSNGVHPYNVGFFAKCPNIDCMAVVPDPDTEENCKPYNEGPVCTIRILERNCDLYCEDPNDNTPGEKCDLLLKRPLE
ncbi:DUF6520 family protein [Flavivirga eckloniae]|uniref:Secreted protein n=1 Tax=Flavivirga eckloniae TaxID=1803846 RepID=A0A2K9PKR8_9FLAO|nr:DUF6520 family protein [Flavivirga eckloniae]AUP77448.1 hypothetical protein C1H87_01415 [Flavivirga eckloniae]